MKTRLKTPSNSAISITAAYLEVEIENLRKNIDNCLDTEWLKRNKETLKYLEETTYWLKEKFIRGDFK